MRLFFHKWYVFAVSVYNILRAIWTATDKIAAVEVALISHKDLDELEKAIAERLKSMKTQASAVTDSVGPIPAKDLN